MTLNWPPTYDDSYVPPSTQKYWFPERETMDPERRLEEVILPKIRSQMSWAYSKSDFFRTQWDANGVDPKKIQSLGDFHKVPIITKEDLRQDLISHPPFGSNICVDWDEILRIHGSSGTTGIPTVIAISNDDWKRIGNAHARIMWGMGIRPSDMIFMAAPFSLYMGSWGALVGGERMGAHCFPFGAGNPGQTRMAVRWIQSTNPTVFYGTPSFALYLAETAREEGIDPRDFGFRILLFSGEPGASVPATRSALEAAYGALIVDSGSTGEMTPWMSNGACSGNAGMHLWQDIVFTELVDPETMEVVPYGQEGVPVYTHLERTSQPLIRFWSGDLSLWTNERCSCGRTYPRLPYGIYGRVDDMVTIRGENVYPSAVANVVHGATGFTGEFRMIVTRERIMDELVVQAEYSSESVETQNDLEILRERLEQSLQATLGIRAQVEMKAPGELERTQFKSKWVIDERDLYKKE